MSNDKTLSLFDPALIRPAVVGAFTKLDPRVQWRNPVMFVVSNQPRPSPVTNRALASIVPSYQGWRTATPAARATEPPASISSSRRVRTT